MSSSVRRKYIRSVATKILESEDCQAPPTPLNQIAQSLKIEIRYQEGEDNLSGFLLRDPSNSKTIIGVNKNHSPNRQRFTIAHEIGHFLLHEGEAVHVDNDNDKKNLRINLRDDAASLGIYVKEREANLFAAELLMPETFIHSELSGKEPHLLDDDALKPIAEKLEVSIQALTYRLSNLGYIWAW